MLKITLRRSGNKMVTVRPVIHLSGEMVGNIIAITTGQYGRETVPATSRAKAWARVVEEAARLGTNGFWPEWIFDQGEEDNLIYGWTLAAKLFPELFTCGTSKSELERILAEQAKQAMDNKCPALPPIIETGGSQAPDLGGDDEPSQSV